MLLLMPQLIALREVCTAGAVHHIELTPVGSMNQHIAPLVLGKSDRKRHGIRVIVTAMQRRLQLAAPQVHQHAKAAAVIDHGCEISTHRHMHGKAAVPIRVAGLGFRQLELCQRTCLAAIQIHPVQATIDCEQQKLAPVCIRSAGMNDGRALPGNAAWRHKIAVSLAFEI